MFKSFLYLETKFIWGSWDRLISSTVVWLLILVLLEPIMQGVIICANIIFGNGTLLHYHWCEISHSLFPSSDYVIEAFAFFFCVREYHLYQSVFQEWVKRNREDTIGYNFLDGYLVQLLLTSVHWRNTTGTSFYFWLQVYFASP